MIFINTCMHTNTIYAQMHHHTLTIRVAKRIIGSDSLQDINLNTNLYLLYASRDSLSSPTALQQHNIARAISPNTFSFPVSVPVQHCCISYSLIIYSRWSLPIHLLPQPSRTEGLTTPITEGPMTTTAPVRTCQLLYCHCGHEAFSILPTHLQRSKLVHGMVIVFMQKRKISFKSSLV